MNQIADRTSALNYLLGRINYERTGGVPYRSKRLKLDRMQRFLSLLGDPQQACPTIHIAGTKGKGSTAALTSRILTENGLRTGLYTSPHLERLEERFTVDGQQADELELVEMVRQVAAVVAQMDEEAAQKSETGPTFFEITTAMAWMRFASHQVDCAVVEVGLGGRLDSTNVCQPVVTAVTSISMDHTRQLGHELGAIAKEKAGILKAGAPVVVGPMSDEPLGVVLGVAKERRCRTWRYGVDFAATVDSERTGVIYSEPKLAWELDGIEVGLVGEHQRDNAAIAVCLARRFAEHTSLDLSPSAIHRGLASTRCPARIELLQRSPLVVLDVAHNPASVSALCQTLAAMPCEGARTLVFSTSRDKDAVGMMHQIAAFFDTIILTKFQDNPRAAPPDELVASWQPREDAKAQVHVEEDPKLAWKRAYQEIPGDGLVCVAGSFFLAAELRAIMMDDVQAGR